MIAVVKATHSHLHQRAPDGYPEGADAYMRESYGSIPDERLFQHPRGVWQEVAQIEGWVWSVTFGRWSALVCFSDGWRGFSFPKR